MGIRRSVMVRRKLMGKTNRSDSSAPPAIRLVAPNRRRERAVGARPRRLSPTVDAWASETKARPPFECIALVLQGGGALGAYEAGVYEALTEADLHTDWIE